MYWKVSGHITAYLFLQLFTSFDKNMRWKELLLKISKVPFFLNEVCLSQKLYSTTLFIPMLIVIQFINFLKISFQFSELNHDCFQIFFFSAWIQSLQTSKKERVLLPAVQWKKKSSMKSRPPTETKIKIMVFFLNTFKFFLFIFNFTKRKYFVFWNHVRMINFLNYFLIKILHNKVHFPTNVKQRNQFLTLQSLKLAVSATFEIKEKFVNFHLLE